MKDQAVFDLFFRKCPFNGEFAIFAGLSDCLDFLENFKFSDEDIDFLKKILPSHYEEEFFTYLRELSLEDIKIYALPEGSIAFPKVKPELFSIFTRKYPLRGCFLGVLTHTTAWALGGESLELLRLS